MAPVQSIPVTIERIEDRTKDVRILTVSPLQPFKWRAGQYAHIVVEGHEPRPFSIASAPLASGQMTFHVRNTGTGLSAHLASENIKIGDMLAIEGPYGPMDPEIARGRPVLMIAGGTGIAPMLALASEILRRGLTEDGITLIYGVRSDLDIYCRKELDVLLATGEITAHILTGVHTPDQELRRMAPDLTHHTIYMSGPDAMMFGVQSLLNELGADPTRIFTDADMNNLQRQPA